MKRSCVKGLVWFSLAAVLLAVALPSEAQTSKYLRLERVPKRVALVIGNSTYLNASPLTGAGEDAKTLHSVLSKLGFDVLIKNNVKTGEDFRKAVDDLSSRVTEGALV